MQMTYLDETGKTKYPIMGCYGIGVGRLAACICEAHHDDRGPIWPVAVAPWQVHLCAVRADDENVRKKADELYAVLQNAGIEVCAGASGNADEAVEAYLRGDLVDTGANCDHHGEGHECGHHGDGDEDGCCGHHEEGEEGCGSGCGGCCGGGAPQIILDGKNAGKNVKVHYRGTFNDGTQFDSSYDRGEPLEFVCGAGMMITGFDKAVADMEVGQTVDIHLMPEEAYGMPEPDRIITIAIAQLPGSENLNVGERVYLRNMNGQPFPVTVTAKDDVNITLDANHEMAGKELNFRIELIEVQ